MIGVSKDEQWRRVCEGHRLQEQLIRLGRVAQQAIKEGWDEDRLTDELVKIENRARKLPDHPPRVYLGCMRTPEGPPADIYAYSPDPIPMGQIARAVVEMWEAQPRWMPGGELG